MYASRRKVLHVIASLELGGAQRVLVDAVRVVDRRRFAPQVVYSHGGFFERDLRPLDVELFPLKRPPPRLGVFGFAAQLARIMRRERPDVVHLHLGSELWGLPVARAYLRRREAIIYNEQTVRWRADRRDSYQGWALHSERLRLGLDRAVGRVIAASSMVRDILIEEWGYDPTRVVAIPNAVEVPLAPPPLPSSRDTIVVGALGRLHPVKGFDVFIDMAVALARRPDAPKMRFVLGGDGPEKETLTARANALGLGDRLIFAGPVHAGDFLAELDIVVVPSRYETFGLVAAEAMAAGRPVVASDVGGLREVVDESCGARVPVQEPGRFADAVLALASNRERRVAAGRAAWARAGEHFSLRAYRRQLEAIYEEAAV